MEIETWRCPYDGPNCYSNVVMIIYNVFNIAIMICITSSVLYRFNERYITNIVRVAKFVTRIRSQWCCKFTEQIRQIVLTVFSLPGSVRRLSRGTMSQLRRFKATDLFSFNNV
jgi:hypothetical protein